MRHVPNGIFLFCTSAALDLNIFTTIIPQDDLMAIMRMNVGAIHL